MTSRLIPPRLDASADRRRIALLVAVAGLAIVAFGIQFIGLTDRLPGFWQDESAIAYNAWTIAQSGVDENGTAWPVLFKSQLLSTAGPVFIYLEAAVFKVLGPSIPAARIVPAASGVATMAFLGLLAYRITRRPAIALFTAATALLTPWLFEPTRLVFEVALMACVIAGFLLVLWGRKPDVLWSWGAVALVAGSLAAITYTYALGRLLGPLLALGLLLYVPRARWRNVGRVWAAYAVLLIPLLAVELKSPGSLTSRLAETGYLSGTPLQDVLARFAAQFLGNIDPRRMLLEGDQNQRHHVAGVMGSLLAGTFALAVVAVDRIAHRLWREPWWRYVLYGLIVSIIPASLTIDLFHAHRLIAVPIFLVVLTIPAQQWLLEHRSSLGRIALAVLVVATLVQGTYFQIRWHQISPTRGAWFDEPYPRLLDEALAMGVSPIYIIDSVQPGYIHAYWYGTLRGIDLSRFERLPGGVKAPTGGLVLSSEPDCSPCDVIDSGPSTTGGRWTLYRVP
jgi:4-amino-4-deoxy-L-arabinose transferase-like glycosyltransferase